MDFKRYLNETAKILDKEISKILDEWEKEVGKISPKLIPLAQAFIKACSGGKRIRGTLVRLGYEMTQTHLPGEVTGVTASSHLEGGILKVGAAYEIFHTSILVHDDIMDESPIRRGKPTLFKALGGDHRGTSLAITLADLGFFLAIKIISESKFPNKEKNEALRLFSKTVVNTTVGQILDIQKEDPILTSRLKTAQYTICGPLALGAILAGADKKLLGLLGLFGENLGMAFQIHDDILGVFGDEKKVGKSVTSDIDEGKNTLLITYALEHTDLNQKEILNKYYGKGKLSKSGLLEIRKIFKECGSLRFSRQKEVEYVEEAKKVIPKITIDYRLSRMLTQMADFLVERVS